MNLVDVVIARELFCEKKMRNIRHPQAGATEPITFIWMKLWAIENKSTGKTGRQ
jgi:hypothetical protein